jgi:hypothetical protein
MRSSAYEQRVTASSASSSVVADGEQEQTSAPTVVVIVERVTVRVLLYIDDILVIYSIEQLS